MARLPKYIYRYHGRGGYIVKFRGHWKTLKTLEEARAYLRELMGSPAEQIRNGKRSVTLAQYIDRFFWPNHKTSLKASSQVTVASKLAKIKSFAIWRDMKLRDIDVCTFKLFQNHISKLTAGYQKSVTTLANQILESAIDDGLLESNPLETLKRKRRLHARDTQNKPPRAKTDVFTNEEIATLLDAARKQGALTHAYVRTGLESGLRPGEQQGLRWSDIDFATRRIHVQQTRSRGNTITTPKNRASYRDFEISRSLCSVLTEYKKVQNRKRLKKGQWKDNDLVFANGTGSAFTGELFLRSHWKPLFKKVKLAYRSPHSLRHTCASLDFQAGMNVLQVARKLGHADPAVTLSTYLHLMDERPTKKSIHFWDNAAISLQPGAEVATI